MAKSHWLDPLARELLRVTGNLTETKSRSNFDQEKNSQIIELEFKKLKDKYRHKRSNSSNKIDVNRASAAEWRQLPECTEAMVELLVRLQKGGVQLSGQEDLIKLLGISNNLAKQWSPYLIFRWYGNIPTLDQSPLLDINSAPKKTILKVLNWPEERVKRLMREREKSPFNHLADLQERLTLPPEVIEELIGVVCFSERKGGPSLPPNN